MKVIITGSEGFIGRALSLALSSRGIEVVGIDRKTGLEASGIAPLITTDTAVVFHLAAQTSVFNDNLTQIRRDNIDTFMAVVSAVSGHPARPKLVYASSSTAHVPNTTSLYGLSKRFAEEYARLYLPTATGVRLHNVYGPDPRQGTLLWCLLDGERVTLHNGGRNVRHFTYIDDAVEGLIYASGCSRQLINVANPESATTARFADIALASGCHASVSYSQAERPLDRPQQAIDTTLPSAPLDYTPLESGLPIAVAASRR